MSEWNAYLGIIFGLGALFFASAIYAFVWAAKKGQFRNFEEGAKSIFTEEEPLGQRTDYFPGQSARTQK